MIKYILAIIVLMLIVGLVTGGVHLYKVGQKNKKDLASYINGEIKYNNNLGKTLVVYYSVSGNTESIAQNIAQKTNADVFKIETKEQIKQNPSFYLKKERFEQFGLYKTDYKIAADFEFLLRVIYKGGIRTQYLPLDMVTMRTGGASTSGFESHKRIMKEHLRAFRENGIANNALTLLLRYPYKIGELIKNKLA